MTFAWLFTTSATTEMSQKSRPSGGILSKRHIKKQLQKPIHNHMYLFRRKYVLWEDVLTAQKLFSIRVSQTVSSNTYENNADAAIVIILSLLLEYMFQQTDGNKANREWPIDLLLDVGVPLDSVLAVLENLSFNDATEWSTARRRVIAALTVYVCQKWLTETTIGGGLPFGGEEGAQAVLEILRGLSDLRLLSGRDADALRDLIQSVQRTV
jgi:hypothetical protein